MTITYHHEVEQGSDEWLAMRCGLITASEVSLLLTPTLKTANNDKSRSHLWELAAQRLTRHVEPRYISEDMLRGMQDEIYARDVYSERYGPITQSGFVTRDFGGFVIGYSPDGLVGAEGLWECKSRRQKFQIETIVSGEMPVDYLLQCQTGLLVTDRAWLDFTSYSAGLPMFTCRVYNDAEVQAAIRETAERANERIEEIMLKYEINSRDLPMTERHESSDEYMETI